MALPYITESNIDDFAEVPEFTLDELLAMMRAASERYTAGDRSAGADIEDLITRIRQDYPTHYEGRR